MNKESVLQIVKATLASLLFSLVFVLVFTLIIQLCSLSGSVIKPVNQVFKILSIAFGGLIFIRGERGFIKGAVFGLVAVIASYVLFGIIGGDFYLGWTFVLELLIGVFAGFVVGIIAVNIKKQ